MLADALKRLSKHSAIYALGPAVGSIAGFLLVPLVTRYIGTTENYGVKEIAQVTIALAVQVLGINLLQGLMRYYSGYEDERDRAALVTTSMFLLAATTGTALVVSLLFRDALAALVFGSEAYAPALVTMAAILFFNSIGQVGLRYLQIQERSGQYVTLVITKLFLEIALKVVFLVALGLTYMGVLYSVLVGEAILAVGLGVFVFTHLGFRFSRPMAARLIRYSYPLAFTGLAGMALHQGDRYVINYLLGLHEAGLYGLAYKFGAMVNAFLLTAFVMIWFPYIFSLRSDRDVSLVCRTVLSYFTVGLVFCSLVVAVFSREVVFLMSDPIFHEAHVAIPMILGGYLCWGMFQVVQTPFYIKEKTGMTALLHAGAAVVNIGLNFLVVPEFGYVGAAWTTLVTFLLLLGATHVFAERLFPVHHQFDRVAFAVVLGLVLFGCSEVLLDGPTTLLSFAGKLLCVLAYPVVLYGSGFLSPPEKESLHRQVSALRVEAVKLLRRDQSDT